MTSGWWASRRPSRAACGRSSSSQCSFGSAHDAGRSRRRACVGGARVVVHERGRGRAPVAVDEQDRARGRARRDRRDRPAGGERRERLAAGGDDGLPPGGSGPARGGRRRAGCAAAARRARRTVPSAATASARALPVPRSRPTVTGPSPLLTAAAARAAPAAGRPRRARAAAATTTRRATRPAFQPMSRYVPTWRKAQRLVQPDARVVGQRHAGDGAAQPLAAQQPEQRLVERAADAGAVAGGLDVDADVDGPAVGGAGAVLRRVGVADDAPLLRPRARATGSARSSARCARRTAPAVGTSSSKETRRGLDVRRVDRDAGGGVAGGVGVADEHALMMSRGRCCAC